MLVGALAIGGCARPASAPSTPATVPAPEPASQTTATPAATDTVDTKWRKPVIYLYPPRTMRVRVHLDVSGVITASDPVLDSTDSWNVVAQPGGKLVASGRPYPYLFWEAASAASFDTSTGFVVPRDEVRVFLRGKLTTLGLNDSESAAFIDYWAPHMEASPYCLVHFEGPAYERVARLEVSPTPDTSIRVFMVCRPLDKMARVTPQHLASPPPRRGFTLVEWGGAMLPADGR